MGILFFKTQTMAVNLETLREISYDILREEQNTSAYPLSLIDVMLNSSYQSICNGRLINPLNKEEVRKGQLSFLNTSKYYSNVPTISLSADTTEWATTLTVSDTTNYPTTGKLYINWNIITYTGKWATTFTWVTGVLFDFASWTEISIAFALPSNFASIINITYNHKFKLPAKLYDDIFEDLNDYKGSNYQRNRGTSIYESPFRIQPFYTIIDNNLVLFQINELDWQVHLRYEKLPTELSASSDEVIIDNDIYAKSTIPYLAIGEMLFNRWEEQRASELINFWIGKVNEMYTYYNNRSYEKLNWVSYSMWKGKLNI